ncbi:Alpha/beta-hydrolase [Mycena kentingensis (nom. inval.)]|nr:Alpha/beta-hydrolase [Mycena kentingensis (nom. inval.)]
MTPRCAPYGTWSSPISAAMVAKMGVFPEDVLVDTVSGTVYYLEQRPDENGRNVLVRAKDGAEVFGREWDARTAVHSYGGSSAAVYNDVILFSNASDNQVYKVSPGKPSPTAVTAANAGRFASFTVHPSSPHLIVCILEDHTNPAPDGVRNSLVWLDTRKQTDSPISLVYGADFYAAPTFNNDGSLLAWTQWSHPDMPWNGEQIYVAAVGVIEDGIALKPEVLPITRIAGAHSTVSASQPTWISHNTLLFSSDISAYHNPFLGTVAPKEQTVSSRPVFAQPVANDFADPSWWLGMSNFALLDGSTALWAVSKAGRSVLHLVTVDGGCKEVANPYVSVTRVRRVGPWAAAFIGSRIDKGPEVVLCSFTGAEDTFLPTYTILGPGNANPAPAIPNGFLSPPIPLQLGGIHIVYYLPKNPAYHPDLAEQPPAIVNVHGGPTYIEKQNLNLEKQFFTSRGWVWIDVNYSGSAGFGRNYANQLNGQWGVADVRDCVQTVRMLASPEYGSVIDGRRTVIRGGSAGGYTTLVALSQPQPENNSNPEPVFAAGTSSYGISDLRKLTEGTHKFQSYYAQALVGGSVEELPDVYRARSPVFHAANIKVPLLILQGGADPIVPPNQAEDMISVIKANTGGGQTVEYVVFDGEGHGWRRAETIEKALSAELGFYQRALNLSVE